jgi:hypothetical protein
VTAAIALTAIISRPSMANEDTNTIDPILLIAIFSLERFVTLRVCESSRELI